MDGKESLSLFDGLESSDLTFLFSRVLVGDFSPVVIVLTCSVLNRRKEFAMRCWIASEFVGDQSPRRFSLSLQDLAEEPLSSSLVPALREQEVKNISILIHCPPEVKLLSLDSHEDLIDVPNFTRRPCFRRSLRA